jgi:hypothetical protein
MMGAMTSRPAVAHAAPVRPAICSRSATRAHSATRSRPSVRTALVCATAIAAALLLTGCSAAQDAASQKASEAADAAKAKASAKASQLAVEAVRAQLCALVKDGAVSKADAAALDGLVKAGETAGVPDAVLSAARSVAEAGTGATKPEVSKLTAEACAAG